MIRQSTAHCAILIREFDEETQKALEEIDGCQNEIDAMNEKASEEILKVRVLFTKPFILNFNSVL